MAQLLDKKHVTVRELAQTMDVSDATVRRDLRILAEEQGLELTHGGASLSQERDYSYQAKSLRSMDAKRIIGHLAGSLVQDGEHIFLDSGTTCSQIVPSLRHKHDVTVLANSARLALELETSNVNLFLMGGEYRPDRMDTIGPMAMASLNTLRGYTAFVGTDGISMDFGPSAGDIESAHLHRQVVTNARKTVLLADHSKFDRASLFQIVDWKLIKTVVTDQRPSDAWLEFLAELSIDVCYPEST